MHKNLPKFNDINYVHFITAKTFQNEPYFKNEKCCLILLEELNFYREKLGFKILGYVIMPDHLHCLIFWEVDEYPKLTISRIMQSVKSHSAKEILYYLQAGRRKPSLSPYSTGVSEGSHLPDSMGMSEGLHLSDSTNANKGSHLPKNMNENLQLSNDASEGSHLPGSGSRKSSSSGSWKPSLGSWKPSLPVHYKWQNTGKIHTAPKTKFWQSGFYDFNIYTEKKLQEKFDYMHNNPIKTGLCAEAGDYEWSSYRQIIGTEKNPVLKVDVL